MPLDSAWKPKSCVCKAGIKAFKNWKTFEKRHLRGIFFSEREVMIRDTELPQSKPNTPLRVCRRGFDRNQPSPLHPWEIQRVTPANQPRLLPTAPLRHLICKQAFLCPGAHLDGGGSATCQISPGQDWEQAPILPNACATGDALCVKLKASLSRQHP